MANRFRRERNEKFHTGRVPRSTVKAYRYGHASYLTFYDSGERLCCSFCILPSDLYNEMTSLSREAILQLMAGHSVDILCNIAVWTLRAEAVEY